MGVSVSRIRVTLITLASCFNLHSPLPFRAPFPSPFDLIIALLSLLRPSFPQNDMALLLSTEGAEELAHLGGEILFDLFRLYLIWSSGKTYFQGTDSLT